MSPFPENTEAEIDQQLFQLLRDFDEAELGENGFDRRQLNELTAGQRAKFDSFQRCLKAIGDLRTDELFSTVLNNGQTLSSQLTGAELSAAVTAPHTMGRFRIEKLIGEGGFARVFLADDPVLKRKVALKIPKPDAMASYESRIRFQREAEAAATLAHPAIIPVFEAGTVGEIQFIAFGFCDGVTLSDLQSTEQQSPRQAAEIVGRVAEAVGHAHDRGVVHRDLKPGNILIQAGAGPVHERIRISDFGLAQFEDSSSRLTLEGAIVGTPAYMSPEQARGNRSPGPRSDIYSMGAIMYELLTRQLPHSCDNLISTLRSIDEISPVCPRDIIGDIPRDLEAICLKCLEKDPRRRYASAYELADDLRRWCLGESVLARRANVVERVFKWASRNRSVTAAFSLAFTVVVYGLVVSQNQYFKTLQEKQHVRQEKRLAEQERERADDVIEIMVGAFQQANLSQKIGDRKSAMDVLLQTESLLSDATVRDPLTRAKLAYVLSRSFFGLGDFQKTIDTATAASAIYRVELGPAHVSTVYALRQLAQGYQFAGQPNESITVLQDALDHCESILGQDHPLTVQSLNYLGIAYIKNSRIKNALATEQEAYERAQRTMPPNNKVRLSILKHLAAAYRINGELEKAVKLNQVSVDCHKSSFGMSPMTVKAVLSLATSLDSVGKNGEAVELLLSTLQEARIELGSQHSQTLRVMQNLIDLIVDPALKQTRLDMAHQLVSESKLRYGDDHPSTTLAEMKLSSVFWDLGREQESVDLLRQSVKKLKDQLGESHPKVVAANQRLEHIESQSH